ncbi:MAG: GNAT family N-acetyltransferase [Litorilinea sp.]
MNITLSQGTPQDRQIVENLMVAFFMDLARYDDQMLINAYGLPMFVPPEETSIESDTAAPVDAARTWEQCRRANWWVRDRCTLYVIRVAGVPAGYAAVLADPVYLPDAGVDFELVDFYIVPKYRGQGVGRAAARLVFDNHRGRWVVYELEKNQPARAFWQQILHEYTHGQFENRQGGVEQRFRN